MIRVLICFLSSFLLLQTVSGADDAYKLVQSKAADAIDKIPASKIRLFLYSLNPHDNRIFEGKLADNSDQNFHRYPVLGGVEITSTQEKTNLLNAFTKGIRESDGMVAACFNPRHGLRIIDGTTTNDFVICFECLQVQAYGFSAGQGFLTSSSPSGTFNQLLDEYHITKANRR